MQLLSLSPPASINPINPTNPKKPDKAWLSSLRPVLQLLAMVSLLFMVALLISALHITQPQGEMQQHLLSAKEPFICHLKPNKGSYCAQIRRKCNTDYFWIAEIYYCSKISTAGVVLFVIPLCFCIIFLLFVSLSILVAKFLYPILNKTCNEFNVNEKFLSCILVPFINCFPDLVNFYISFKTNSIDLALGQVVGSILIIFTLVMGSICVLQPFEILKQKSLLMNDFVSVFIVVVVFLYVLSDGRITLIECGVMVTMYVAYVIYLLYQPLYEVAEPDSTATEDGGDVPTRETDLERGVVSEFDNRLMSVPSFGIEDALSVLSDEIENNQNSDFQQSVSINYGTFDHDRDFMQDDDDTGESFRAPVKPAFQGRSSNFDGNVGGRGFGMTSEISLRSSIWNESHNYTVKNFMLGILRSVQVVFNLIDISLFVLLPYNDEQTDKPEQDDSVRETTVTDRDKTTPPNHSIWLNWRNSPHTPLLIYTVSYLRCIVIPITLYQLGDLPYIDIRLPVVGSLVILFTVWNHWLMPFTPVFLVRAFTITMIFIIISIIATTILEMLKNLGVIFKISESLLGLTFFAISNSINDIITNITLANLGKPILGINACLGTPLLNILLGIGFNGTLIILRKKGSLKLDVNPHLVITTAGLLLILIFHMVYIPLNGWKLDRRLGMLSISWWIIITIINCFL